MHKYLLYLLLTALLFTACEKVIPYEEQSYTEGIVFNSVLVSGEPISILVSRTQSILQDNYDPVNGEFISTRLSDCTVSLYENGTLVAQTTEDNSGRYDLNYIPIAGPNYRLEIQHPDLPDASAETSIPPTIPITYANGAPTADNYTRIELGWTDTPEVKYYAFAPYSVDSIFQFQQLTSWSTSSPYFPTDATGDGMVYYYDDGVFLDELFKNEAAQLEIETYDYFGNEEGHSLKAVLLTCSESYYLYKSSVRLYRESNGGLFAQPVQIYSNVTGGYGVLAGVSVSSREVAF